MEKELDYNCINRTMKTLEKMKIPLTRAALCVALEDGIATQETKFTYYMVALNLYDMYLTGEEITFEKLTQVIPNEYKPEILEKYKNVFSES